MRRLCLALVLALVSLGAAGAQPPERARLHEVELGNGLQVLGYRDDSTSLVGVFLAVKVGAQDEGDRLRGVRDLLQEAFRVRLETLLRARPEYLDLTGALLAGPGLDLATEWDYVSVLALCPRAELPDLLRVMGQVLFTEPLDEAALDTGRQGAQRQWEATRSNPAETTYYLLRRALLGPGAGAEPVFADPQRLEGLTPAAVEQFRREHFVPANTLLLLVGPDSPEALLADSVSALETWPRRPASGRWPVDYPPRPSQVVVDQSPHLIQEQMPVAALMLGFRLPPMGSTQFPAALVLQEMLTGREGLLPSSERLRRALTWYGYGWARRRDVPLQVLGVTASSAPHLVINLQTHPAAIEEVRAALMETLAETAGQAREPQSLQRAQRRALSTLALSGLDQRARARRLGEWMLYSGSYPALQELPGQLAAVNAEQVRQVAEQVFARQYVAVQMPQ